MARISHTLSLVHRGLDDCLASFASASEAASNAHGDMIELEFAEGAIRFQGMALVDIGQPRIEDFTVICEVKPTAAIILFAAWLMSKLPSRARVTWGNGWPTFYCPPNDDRDAEGGPTPLIPNELVPA